ncbi:hypothetical protein CSUI_008767, partial [Cystoisospora suis]
VWLFTEKEGRKERRERRIGVYIERTLQTSIIHSFLHSLACIASSHPPNLLATP